MPEFVLDTGARESSARFKDLDAFTQGYITAAFFTCSGYDEDGDMKDVGFNDLAPETLRAMCDDCADFNLLADAWLYKAYTHGDMSYDMERAGTDFWFTRNRHGAGFWDRGLGAVGEKLSEMARTYGSFDLYRGDDGKIYG